ncbi:MAG: CRISPR-associated endonuclease Cas2 [Thermodesulfobacteriota bacterium]
MAALEHLYLVSYDVCDDRRWRRLFKTMKGYGEWLQLSVFQCRLSRMRVVQLEAALAEIIDHGEDHVLIVDLGPAANVLPQVKSLGRPFAPPSREPVIV